MERWAGRVALVTGASSGIGLAIAVRLAELGMKVIGCARNITEIQNSASKSTITKGSLNAIQCDLAKEEQILAMFEKIKTDCGGVDVCVNNAGISHDAPLLTGATYQWENMFDINVIALSICTREAVKSMRERNVDDGHIIHIGSMSGHRVLPNSPHINMYAATKFAVRALTEGLRNELADEKSHIRVTHISPGMVHTEFNRRMWPGDPQRAEASYHNFKTMISDDIADSVVYALGAPAHVQVHDILIRPTECTY